MKADVTLYTEEWKEQWGVNLRFIKKFVVGGMTTISYFIVKQQPGASGSFRRAEIHKSGKLCHILKLSIQLEGLPFTPRQFN